jgi:hypothetical protein
MTRMKLLQDRAAKARRLALRASGANRTRRSERLLERAGELEREAGEAKAAEAAEPVTVHPFIGSAPEAGIGVAAAPLGRDDDDPKV